jgi:hypothetical protein
MLVAQQRQGNNAAREETMTIPQRSEQSSEPPTLPNTALVGSVPKRPPSCLRRIIAGMLVLTLALGGIAAYYNLSGFFNANGTWYGTMAIHTGSKTLAIETYMDVSTWLTGNISGEGTFCIPLPFNNTATFVYRLSGRRTFPLPSNTQRDQQRPITLTAQYGMPLLLSLTLPLGPSLQLEGYASPSRFHLIGGDGNASTALDMRHGTKAAFMSACSSLAPLQGLLLPLRRGTG